MEEQRRKGKRRGRGLSVCGRCACVDVYRYPVCGENNRSFETKRDKTSGGFVRAV